MNNNIEKNKPKISTIIILLLASIIFGILFSSQIDDYIEYFKKKNKPSTDVVKKIEENCGKEKDTNSDTNRIITKCSAKLKYKVNGKTYTTKRTLKVEDIPDKVYYESKDPSTYYLLYSTQFDLVVAVIVLGIILVGCLIGFLLQVIELVKNK